ncbi:MAG TPA: DNA polymerase III subunit delta' [Candidatus Udaeobacter sp.]|nr:DNA polymerase III subunit delta' [Candidatus Udaeobacter sp.]
MEPQETAELVGQEASERALLEGARSGRLHHAWLLTGPRGIGKATLAYRFARFLLAGAETSGLFADGPSSLAVDPRHPVSRLVASGGHPDLKVVARSQNPKTGRMRSEIVVDDVRDAVGFLRLTPSMGGWRVVIIDGAEEMNRNAGNALLKILEEPPARAVLLLASHSPGRLLPTIRSRCRRLSLRTLDDEAIAGYLSRTLPELGEADRRLLIRLAEGSIGRALALSQSGGLDLYRDIVGLLTSLPRLDSVALNQMADRLGRSGADDAFRSAAELLTGWLARMLRQRATGRQEAEVLAGEAGCMDRLGRTVGLGRWLAFLETTERQFALIDPLNLDRRLVWIGTLLQLQQLVAA